MAVKKQSNHFIRIVRDNYIVVAIAFSILLVVAILGIKILSSSHQEVYVKVKVSQGLWWANTGRPNYWFVHAIKKGEAQTNLAGQKDAEIVDVRYYPYWDPNQYDTFVTLKLLVSQKNGAYYYERNTLGVGAPINFEFPETQFSATVLAISDQPFDESRVEKTITLQKNYAYPWEYDAINIGDSYSDGDEKVFEIVDKSRTISSILSQDASKNLSGTSEIRNNIIVTGKVKVQQRDGQYFLGDEQSLRQGNTFQMSTNSFHFDQYLIISLR